MEFLHNTEFGKSPYCALRARRAKQLSNLEKDKYQVSLLSIKVQENK